MARAEDFQLDAIRGVAKQIGLSPTRLANEATGLRIRHLTELSDREAAHVIEYIRINYSEQVSKPRQAGEPRREMAQHYEERNSDDRDLVLAPNEFAYILDETKGNVQVYVGPHKSSPAGTDQPVRFDERSKRFTKCTLEQSKQKWITAPKGWYIVLKNPSEEDSREHPKAGTIENLPTLGIGKKTNIQGPASFPLWPGQMVRVIKGHHLRSNQFVLVRVYDEEAAKENWGKGVVKTREGDEADLPKAPDLTMGKLLVIKGTEVSFYIPSPGLEVVPEGDNYVRDAVTLENLEYSILLDENGNKTFRHGPDVVFPEPTETFVQKDGHKKFRALELNQLSGIYVKVIKEYTEIDGTKREAGDELWITGKDQSIYYPRAEHAVIKYGNQTIHYAVAIPKGEGRYVLDRDTGEIELMRGPKMLLLDPRKYVIARRVLPEKAVKLWFPGNTEALHYNRALGSMVSNKGSGGIDFVTEDAYRSSGPVAQASVSNWAATGMEIATTASGAAINYMQTSDPADQVVGEDFDRKQKFTPPRSITLDTKYDGAVKIDVWPNYAVMVKSATGERKVIVGPDTVLLEYDEGIEKFKLSKGIPKSDHSTVEDVYLRIKNNQVSDQIEVETRDMCTVTVQLKYTLDFEGDDPEQWFGVENYVQFLVDRMRSMLKNLVRSYDIKTFYANPVAIIRDSILGASGEGGRSGRLFPENQMRVYDVEVLAVALDNTGIESALIEAQQESITSALFIASKEQELEKARKAHEIDRLIAAERTATTLKQIELDLQKQEAEHKKAMAAIEEESAKREAELLARAAQKAEEQAQAKAAQLATNEIKDLVLAQRQRATDADLQADKERNDIEVAFEKSLADIQAALMKSDVEAVKEKLTAMSGEIAQSLNVLGDKELAQKLADSLSWGRMVGGENIGDILTSLASGTSIQDAIQKFAGRKFTSKSYDD